MRRRGCSSPVPASFGKKVLKRLMPETLEQGTGFSESVDSVERYTTFARYPGGESIIGFYILTRIKTARWVEIYD